MPHKSATQIGTLRFKATGLTNVLHLGHNRNTGETILWQRVAKRREQRMTGRNLVKLAAELNTALNEGEAEWVSIDSHPSLDALYALIKS